MRYAFYILEAVWNQLRYSNHMQLYNTFSNLPIIELHLAGAQSSYPVFVSSLEFFKPPAIFVNLIYIYWLQYYVDFHFIPRWGCWLSSFCIQAFKLKPCFFDTKWSWRQFCISTWPANSISRVWLTLNYHSDTILLVPPPPTHIPYFCACSRLCIFPSSYPIATRSGKLITRSVIITLLIPLDSVTLQVIHNLQHVYFVVLLQP